ncbi:cytochrome P450 [Armillaria luteobubalina]|uniref:Cytochrome P450 n=1 Tax=Armillaria luteobubalina TaxID=153913 RepID=A0AA39QBK1_9AGAR|nr:cytochrome P450 [Armillaria luteobubalina]
MTHVSSAWILAAVAIVTFIVLRSKQWLTFTELGRKYGDLMYFNVAGQPLIVINSLKVATDLLDRAKFSDRPRNIVASDIMTRGMFVAFAPYGNAWRHMRKAAHEGLNKSIVNQYHPIQIKEAVLLAADLLAEPSRWISHVRRTAASTIMSIVYDKPPTSEQDPSIKQINDFATRLTRAAMPGAHFVESFPWMLRIPSKYAKWKREAEGWYAKDSFMFESLFHSVKEQIAKGNNRPSFAATLVESAGRHGLTDRENSWLAGTMYTAGAESSSAAMSWWMLAMVLYPDVQKRAQAELDKVVGRDRLPSFSDYEHLPYVRAMVKETLRWRAVVRLPHRSTEDDIYNGYFIPAGSILIANVWHINRDPENYGLDAEHFDPARHFDESGELAPVAGTKEEKFVHVPFPYNMG